MKLREEEPKQTLTYSVLHNTIRRHIHPVDSLCNCSLNLLLEVEVG
jgi:hypothetical protein